MPLVVKILIACVVVTVVFMGYAIHNAPMLVTNDDGTYKFVKREKKRK